MNYHRLRVLQSPYSNGAKKTAKHPREEKTKKVNQKQRMSHKWARPELKSPPNLRPQARSPKRRIATTKSTLKRLPIHDSKSQKQPPKEEEANGCEPSASEARKSSSALLTRTSVASFIEAAALFPFRPFRPIRSSSSSPRGWRCGWAASFGAARAV